jgi:hypothetical protein
MKYLVFSVIFQFIAGFVWYGILFKEEWIQSTGVSEAEISNLANQNFIHLSPMLFGVLNTIFVQLVYKNTKTEGIGAAMRWGALLWLFVLFPSSLHHHAYQGRLMLCFIDSAKDFFCLLIAGLFVGLANNKAKPKSD